MADNSYKNILDNLKEIVNRRLTSGSGAISSTNLVLDFQKKSLSQNTATSSFAIASTKETPLKSPFTLSASPFIENKAYNLRASPLNEGRYSYAHMQTDLSRKPLFGGTEFNTTQSQIATKSVATLKTEESQEKLTRSIDRLTQKIDQLVQAGPSGGGRGAGGGFVGGGDGGSGGGGRTNQNRGFLSRTFGKAAASGITTVAEGLSAYADFQLNAEVARSTAPISTASNIAKLQGYQQGRFIRDFGNFDAESLILRNSYMRYAGQDSLVRRIDPIAKEASRKQDRAESNRALFDSLQNIGKATMLGLAAGSVIPGVGNALGAAGGFAIGTLKELSSGALSPKLQRNQSFDQDLRMKARTEFDTSTIMANTAALEEAEKERNKISIYTTQKYQESLNPRIVAQEQGRFLDLTSRNINQAAAAGLSTQTLRERRDVSTAIRKSAQYSQEKNTYSSRLKEELDAVAEETRTGIEGVSGFGPAQFLQQATAVVTGGLKTITAPFKAFQNKTRTERLGQLESGEAVYTNPLEDPTVKKASEAFKLNKIKDKQAEEGGLMGVLHGMGYAASSQEGIRIISQFGNIGGAGSRGITGSAADVNALNRIKGMSQSGLGSAEQLLGQAGILGRLSGGVSEAGNVKKLEEVMSRAVASGMNNSDLTSAFMQNITSKAAEMGTTDVEGVARLVQKMQMTGGGQLVDYERMNRSLSGADAASKQNLYVKSNIRANMMNTISANTNIRGERAAILTQGLDEMSTAQLSELAKNAEQYAKGGKLKKGMIGYNLLATMERSEAGQINKNFVKNVKGDRIAGMLGMSRDDFKTKYGVYPSEYDKLPNTMKVKIRGEASMMQGFDATMFDDSATFSGGKEDYGKKSAVDQKKVSEAEKKLAIRTAEAKAKDAATAMGGRSEEQSKVTLKRLLTGKEGGKTLEQLSQDEQYKDVISGLGIKSKEGYAIAEKMIKGEKLSTEEQKFAKDAGLSENLQKSVFQLGQQSVEAKAQMSTSQGEVMSKENATLLGAAFADAFFGHPKAKEMGWNQGKK